MCRAEVQMKVLDLQSSKGSQSIMCDVTYRNVIADYSRAHELKTNSTAIVQAVIVAIDNGKNPVYILFDCLWNLLCWHKLLHAVPFIFLAKKRGKILHDILER